MSLPLKRNRRFHQGYFRPMNPEKYIGKDVPIYRSGIECKFFRFCDGNPNVLKWSSENVKIPYWDEVTCKQRTYYVDNFVKIREGNIVKSYLVELKDYKETRKPDPGSKKKKGSLLFEQFRWVTNNCKWRSAVAFAKNHKCEFLLLAHTEKQGFFPIKLDFLLS
jgi:hypothetical protein